MKFSDKEQAGIRTIAGWYSANRDLINRKDAMASLDMTTNEYEPFMQRMQSIGAIHNVDSQRFNYFKAHHTALDLLHQIEEQKRDQATPDLVEQIQRRFKRNPLAAWMIVVISALAFLAVFGNQAWALYDRVVALKERPSHDGIQQPTVPR